MPECFNVVCTPSKELYKCSAFQMKDKLLCTYQQIQLLTPQNRQCRPSEGGCIQVDRNPHQTGCEIHWNESPDSR